jgi:deoxyhypusine synthase
MFEHIVTTGLTLEDYYDQQNPQACINIPNGTPKASQPLLASSAVIIHPHGLSVSASAILGKSDAMPAGSMLCQGPDLNSCEPSLSTSSLSSSSILETLVQAFATTGFQATNLALAVEQIRSMRQWRLSDTPWKEGDDQILKDPEVRKRIRARIFLAYTSNQISCGQREILRYLVEHNMVDVIVTTAGGIEEDIIKCFNPTYMGDFKLSGKELLKKGLNRTGNLLVPNKNYCDFEAWLSPLLHKLHDEQDAASLKWAKEILLYDQDKGGSLPVKFNWTPSKIIQRLGTEINHPESVLYWAARNNIPVFCPAITDGSLGDMIYFHSYQRPGLVVDIAEDVRRIDDLAIHSHCTGQIILGGGIVKHHTCNANYMRKGADYSVYINTAQEFDGSDSGASPDEAVSWGKIRVTARPVKVHCDATIAFPLIVSQTFAKDVEAWKKSMEGSVCWVDDLIHANVLPN